MFFINSKKIKCPNCNKKILKKNSVCPNCNFRLKFPKLKGIDGFLNNCYFHDKDPA